MEILRSAFPFFRIMFWAIPSSSTSLRDGRDAGRYVPGLSIRSAPATPAQPGRGIFGPPKAALTPAHHYRGGRGGYVILFKLKVEMEMKLILQDFNLGLLLSLSC